MSATERRWEAPPATAALIGEDVHVWFASLDRSGPNLRWLADTLSADERERAARFHFARDRRRFIVGRGVLRVILGRYLGVDPPRVAFRYGVRGKPALAGIAGARGLRFNLAHSGGRVLYAVTRDREIGVDLEHVRPLADVESIVQRFFSARENAAFRALPAPDRLRGFFDCWTRKEAYIKALGAGLSRRLDRFDVTLAPEEPARFLWIDGDPGGPSRWTLLDLEPEAGWAAAVALEGPARRFSCWGWPERGWP